MTTQLVHGDTVAGLAAYEMTPEQVLSAIAGAVDKWEQMMKPMTVGEVVAEVMVAASTDGELEAALQTKTIEQLNEEYKT